MAMVAAPDVAAKSSIGVRHLASNHSKTGRSKGRFDGKIAVITDAMSGIGLRAAEVFVAEVAKIVIAGRRIPEGEAMAKQFGLCARRFDQGA